MPGRKLLGPLAAFAAAALLFSTSAMSASNGSLAYLGKPTNDVPNSCFPLGGFRHVPDHLTLYGKPVIEFMETSWDDYSATVGWPLVKALDQFGQLTGVKALSENCPDTYPTPVPTVFTHIPKGGPWLADDIETAGCGTPGFDFSHLGYRSPYVSARVRILMDRAAKAHVNALSRPELKIYDKYGRTVGSHTNEAINIAASVYGSYIRPGGRRLPLLLIGHYLEVKDQYVLPRNDFGVVYRIPPTHMTHYPSLSFSEAQTALATHRNPSVPSNVQYLGSILPDVNTDANLMTALICRADGLKPKSVCGRSVITKILRHVK